MKVIAMVRTTVPMEIEVDDKFQALVEMTPDELWDAHELTTELLEEAGAKLPDTDYLAEVMSVETTDGLPLADW